jgi:GntR family transcriptional regulator, transcriptional repressor for pyruvate dehydrogenase complex
MSPPETQSTQTHTTASETVTDALARRILGGQYGPDERLPTERDLALEFEVSRHTVREALKRLQARGLVRIRQGSGIYAADLGLSGGLELFELYLFDEAGDPDFTFLRDFFEFRAHLTREVVRLAALRRTEEDVAELRAAVAERALACDDLERLGDVNLRLFHIISRATQNRFYQLAFNSMGRVVVRVRVKIPFAVFNPADAQEALEHIVDAIAEGDAEMAALLANRLVEAVEELAAGLFGSA